MDRVLTSEEIMNLPLSEEAQRRIDGNAGLARDFGGKKPVLREAAITPEELGK